MGFSLFRICRKNDRFLEVLFRHHLLLLLWFLSSSSSSLDGQFQKNTLVLVKYLNFVFESFQLRVKQVTYNSAHRMQ